MHGAAVVALADGLVSVELLEHRRQVDDDVPHLQLDLVQEVVAVQAVPLELLQHPSSRMRSITTPTEPGSGRCGECGVLRGSSHISPSRTCCVTTPSSVC